MKTTNKSSIPKINLRNQEVIKIITPSPNDIIDLSKQPTYFSPLYKYDTKEESMNCKRTITIILDTFISNGELKYIDYEDIVIQTLHNFGTGTVDTLIKKLEEFQQKEQQMEKELNNEIQ